MPNPSATSWMTLPAGFDEIKSAQMAAYFAQQSAERLDKLKLIKLIYLSEREYLDRHSLPMTLDEFYSMKDGPIASAALNGLNGLLTQSLWDKWITRIGNKIGSAKKRERKQFDHLSEADISVMNAVWNQFGAMSTPEIWNYVHTKCPEYQSVQKGRLVIRYVDILKVLKKDHAERIDSNIRALRREAAFL
jgi:uncharacterized phage-associated protein